MPMPLRRSIAVTALGALTALGAAGVAGAQDTLRTQSTGASGAERAVFVQTDNPAGNAVDVFAEHPDGRLSLRQVVATGGLGGRTMGSTADRLSSQGSLVYDPSSGLLFVVNAGSDSLSVLSTDGPRVRLLQTIGSGGAFPASVAVHDGLVYVLDAGGSGAVNGYRLFGDHLVHLPHSERSLGLANTTPPFFLDSPAQVGFSATGADVVVTTKNSTDSLDVFRVNAYGLLSATPAISGDPGNVPFAFVLTPSGRLVVAEAGPGALQTYRFTGHGTVTSIASSAPDGQSALCWITEAGHYYYVANAGSNDVSSYTVDADGAPSLDQAVAAVTDSGSIDLAASWGNLYVEAGVAGAVDEFHVNPNGTLSDLGSVAGLGTGIEGIATT